MMGGEFCGNAAMSLAAFLVWRDGEATLGGINVPIEVSGADGVVDCLIRRQEGGYRGTVRMPPPDGIEELTLPLAGAYRKFTSVRLPGITHVVVPLEIFGAKRADDRAVRDETERTAREWARLIEDAAFGLLLYDDANTSITPLVLVRSIGTMVWERGCGSGSAAIGAYIAKKSGCDAVSSVIQPGGVIEVDARLENGVVSDVSITGNVRITARGTAYV
jgi:diaminopimelate epimerase